MKRAKNFFLVLAVLALCCASKQPAQKFVQEIDAEAKVYNMINDPTMGPFARKVFQTVPQYRELIQNEFPHTKGLHIDFVMVGHYNAGLTEQQLSAVRHSQRESKKLLDNLKADVIGVEAFYTDVSLENLAQKFRESDEVLASLLRKKPTEEENQALIKENLEIDAALQYKEEHPEAVMIGVEEKNLYFFLMVCTIFMNRSHIDPHSAEVATLRFLLGNRTRNKIVIGKTIAELRRRDKTKGLIIMGAAHEEEFRQIASAIGLSSTFHNTLPVTIHQQLNQSNN